MNDYDKLIDKMKKAISHLEEEFATIRAGRANPAILNKITVSYYGVDTLLSQVASISVPEARQIVIQPWDKSLINEISKEINKAEIGINPIVDGNGIRLVFPELTEDRRKELVKEIKKLSEETKVTIRNIRREGIDEAKNKEKNNEITEDELKYSEQEIQKITDEHTKKVDEYTSNKEKEILSI